MAKPRKIKRYNHRSSIGNKSGVGMFIRGFFLLLFAGLLVFIGTAIYQPVVDFVRNATDGSSSSLPDLLEELGPQPLPEPEEEPEPALPELTGELKAVYLPGSLAQSEEQLSPFLTSLKVNGNNAVMLDVKNEDGEILYQSAQPQALEWGAVGENAVDLAALAGQLEAQGIFLVVRMQTFRDPIGARGDRRANAIHYQGSEEMLWLDNSQERGGRPWLNPYASQAKAYLLGLVEELADFGAVMIVLDGVQFPDDTGNYATFGSAADGVPRLEALQSFVLEAEALAAAQGSRIAVQIPSIALTQSQSENRYGTANPLELAGQIVLDVTPGAYENNFSQQGLVLEQPLADPAATVAALLTYAKGRANRDQLLIPLLQGGPMEGGFTELSLLETQQTAATGAGCQETIWYAPTGAYFWVENQEAEVGEQAAEVQ